MSGLEYLKQSVEDKTINMQNPTCIACNECCSMDVILTLEEHEKIEAYLHTPEGVIHFKRMKNKIKRYNHRGIVYGLCPFTDDTTKRCTIYEMRPSICRAYHCGLEDAVIKENRKTHEKAKSIRDLFFD